MFKDVEKRQGMGADFHSKHKYTCREKVAYMIDRGFESPRIQALLIAFILILGICIGAVLIFIGDKYVTPDDPSVPGYGPAATFAEAIWKSWTYMADPGTHADVDSNFYFRTSAFITAIMGILLMAAIIGFVVDAIKKKMDALDTGRSRVVIKGHILIMGWTEKTIQVIDQIALMMESEGGGTIVLCSDKAKRDAQDEVMERCTLLNSKIIVRTGSISSQSDLAKMAASFARAIIVLAPEGAADKADASVLRCVLSLKGLSIPLSGHVVAEMRDIDNTSLVEVVGGSSVETIVSHDIVGRLMIQAAMLNELDLDERDDRLVDGGLDPSTGLVNLKLVHHVGNPAVKRKLEEVSVSQFDSVLILSDEAFEEDMMHSDSHSLAILLLIRDLQLNDKNFLAKQNINILKGSSKDFTSFSFKHKLSGMTGKLAKASEARTPLKSRLAQISPTKQKPIATTPNSANESSSGAEEKGKKILRRLSAGNGATKAKKLFRKGAIRKKEDWKKDIIKSSSCIVTCEILDPTTHTMIMQNPAIAHMSDYVLSNNTVSKVLAMVAESREVKSVLKELLGSSGCDIGVFPLNRYTHTGVDISFWDLFAQVRKRGEILIGYIFNEELFLNPKSADRSITRSWDLSKDRLVIVSSKKTGISRSRSSQ
eukprot:g8390.t1